MSSIFQPEPPIWLCLAILATRGIEGQTQFLSQQLTKFETVFFLLGNHEPYHNIWADVKARVHELREAVAERKKNGECLGEFIFLDQTRHDVSRDVTVLGCTLRSHILDDRLEYAHLSDLRWLIEQVRLVSKTEPWRKIIILTDHSPAFGDQATDPKHAKSLQSLGFSTDLSAEKCWLNPGVKPWAFGHTHFNCDYMDEKTGKRVVTNQRGYYFAQAVGFDEGKVVSVLSSC